MTGDSRQLILIRHAAVHMESAVPPAQWHLSAAGKVSCCELAPQIGRYHPVQFVTSCEPKARETAQILAESLGLPWQTAENLHEQDRCGAPYYESKQEFEAAVARLLTGPDDEQLLGLETAAQARQRFERAVRGVLVKHPVGNIAIVAHGTVITLFLCRYNPSLSPVTFWRRLRLPSYKVVSLPEFELQA